MAYLAEKKQRKIDGVIECIKETSDCYYPLVSLDRMAQGCGVEVVESDLKGLIEGRNLSGLITYDDPAKKLRPRIFLESGMKPERKKFTLAHELGHHFLHKGEKFRLDDFDYSVGRKEKGPESEANYFAASLLMPASPLLWKIGERKTVGELAEYFGVSLSAIRNRIGWISGGRLWAE